MKGSKVFFLLGCLLCLGAAAFLIFAVNHPEASFPWPNTVTYSIYILYLALTAFLFLLGKKGRSKK